MSSKLKFCANLTTMYTKETTNLLERYSLAQQSGFQAVECAFPYAFTKEELVKVQTDSGLEQILLNTDPGTSLGFAALVNQEQKFMESLQKSIQYCQAVKCQKLHIMSGKITENVTASTQVLKDNLKKALPLLEKAGIVGLIEPINPYWVPNYFLNDFDLAADIINEINHPNLKLMLDVFHLQYLKGNLSNNIPKVRFLLISQSSTISGVSYFSFYRSPGMYKLLKCQRGMNRTRKVKKTTNTSCGFLNRKDTRVGSA